MNQEVELQPIKVASVFHLYFVIVMVAVLGLTQAPRALAQTFTALHTFSEFDSANNNSDGAGPLAGLIASSNTLYGTASDGGSSGAGTLFQLNADGSSFRTLHFFTKTYYFTNIDGANPNAGLVLSGTNLYGTAYAGGPSGHGTVFTMNINGTGFRSLHNFEPTLSATNGAFPGALILSEGILYGTTYRGGISNNGTLFKINTDGSGFTHLHSFAGTDGVAPLGQLALSDGRLYGTTSLGGASDSDSGTLFAVNIDGSDFRILHSFTAYDSNTLMNGDGALPNGGVIISGNNLYGTTMFGGSGGSGTVFEVNTNGSGFRPLHSFTAMEPTTGANGDGAFPVAALILSGETLYGTAKYGGEWGNGTVFAINTNGTDFSNLYSFAAIDRTTGTNTSGAFLFSTLALYDNTLFGTADSGGGAGNGTIFSIILPPQLNVVASDAGLALNWPTNASGFTLQSTTNLHSPVWTTVPTEPVVVERQNVVTNFIDGTPRFYRLKR